MTLFSIFCALPLATHSNNLNVNRCSFRLFIYSNWLVRAAWVLVWGHFIYANALLSYWFDSNSVWIGLLKGAVKIYITYMTRTPNVFTLLRQFYSNVVRYWLCEIVFFWLELGESAVDTRQLSIARVNWKNLPRIPYGARVELKIVHKFSLVTQTTTKMKRNNLIFTVCV